MFKTEINNSGRINLLPPGRISNIRLTITAELDSERSKLQATVTQFLTKLSSLPNGWNNFSILNSALVVTKNLSGIARGDLTANLPAREELLHIEGELLTEATAEEENPIITANIFTNFYRTLRLGENEYKLIGEAPQGIDAPTAVALLERSEFKLSLLRFGITHFRRFSFGPIANPFPMIAGTFDLRLHGGELTIAMSYFKHSDLPELALIAALLEEQAITKVQLDSFAKTA